MLTRLKLAFEFTRRDAVDIELPQKALAFVPPVQNVCADGCHEQYRDPTAKTLNVRVSSIELAAEDKADPGVSACPKKGTKEIEELGANASSPKTSCSSPLKYWMVA